MPLASWSKCFANSIVVLATVLALPGLVCAELIDDFNDGNDAGWTHFDGLAGTPWGPTIYDAGSGRYAISSTNELPPLGYIVPTGAFWTQSIGDPTYSNGFVRTLFQIDNQATGVATVMRFDVNSGDGYAFGVDVAGDSIFIARVDGGTPTLLGDAPFDLTTRQDYYLETRTTGPDVLRGANISLKIWAVGEPEPSSPQLVAFDASYITGGFGLLVTNVPGGPGGRLSARFDDVHFYIPEPTSLLLLALGGLTLARRYPGANEPKNSERSRKSTSASES